MAKQLTPMGCESECLCARLRSVAPLFCLAMSAVVTVGCHRGPKRIEPVHIDTRAAAKLAMQQYDANGDGSLAPAELKQVPGILESMENFDQDQDGTVSSEELATRMGQWEKHRRPILTLRCRVTLDGRPLPGAEVEFIPETFLEQSIETAKGTTDATGAVRMEIPEENRPPELMTHPGIQAGLYKVRITHPQKKLPRRYHAESELGQEVAKDRRVIQTQFKLTSR